MSDLEFCRNAHEGNLHLLREKISSNKAEDLSSKKDSVCYKFIIIIIISIIYYCVNL